MKVHLNGFGLTGALLAHRLSRFGVEFTWYDPDLPRTAWKASTGAIYPAGSYKFGPDKECWEVWQRWHQQEQFGPHLEAATYIFGQKQPPHGGKYGTSRDPVYDLGIADVPSFHFNAQSFVPEMRRTFEEKRLDAPVERGDRKYDFVINAHGFGDRYAFSYWGWTRLVRLSWDELTLGIERRPCFYFRPNKVQMAYAYPVPGTKWWYAGSSIIQQKAGNEKSLSIEPKYEKWKELFLKLAKGSVIIAEEGDFLEGWRPAAAPTDTAWIRRSGNYLSVRPLWNSGIRHFPSQWAGIAAQLGITDGTLTNDR
jgi:hypothetical protein